VVLLVKQVFIFIFLLLVFFSCSDHKQVKLEFRIAEDEPASGLTGIPFPPTGEYFYPHDEVLVDETDVDSAFVIRQEGHPAVELILTSEGTQKFGELTERNVGKRCGMVLNGQLVSAPRIMAPIHVGRAKIVGVFTEKEAQRIAQSLSNP
jgi:preprotein translocase subunit SecD